MIICYTSSQGWGHNGRVIPILDQLYDYQIEVVSTAPEWFIKTSLTKKRKKPLTVRYLLSDPGAIQSDPFKIDNEKTIQGWKDNFSNIDSLLRTEIEYLQKKKNVKLILADISYFGQLVAEALNIPSICIATFDWPFIHQNLRKTDTEFSSILDKVQEISQRFNYCLIPGPICKPLNIGQKQIQFHWASRKPHMDTTDVRKILKLSVFDDSVLFSFGGHSLNSIPFQIWENFNNIQFFILLPNSEIEAKKGTFPENLHPLSQEEWSCHHTDLLNTVDCVFGKLGYGLCSEVIACRKPFLIVQRINNPECEFLKNDLKTCVPIKEITPDQFYQGEWHDLYTLFEKGESIGSDEYIKIPVDGEVQISKFIRKQLSGRENPGIDSFTLYIIGAILLLFIMVIYRFFRK